MALASKAFEENRRQRIYNKEPSPTEPRPESPEAWHRIRNGEMPPLMFQLRFRSGEVLSYAYSDLREIRFRDAGFVQLGLFGMSRVEVTIQGRHLRELSESLGSGLIRWLQEADERDDEIPESQPQISEITIETFPGR